MTLLWHAMTMTWHWLQKSLCDCLLQLIWTWPRDLHLAGIWWSLHWRQKRRLLSSTRVKVISYPVVIRLLVCFILFSWLKPVKHVKAWFCKKRISVFIPRPQWLRAAHRQVRRPSFAAGRQANASVSGCSGRTFHCTQPAYRPTHVDPCWHLDSAS